MPRNKEVRVYAPPTLVEDVDTFKEREGLSSHSAAWKELARRALQREGIDE